MLNVSTTMPFEFLAPAVTAEVRTTFELRISPELCLFSELLGLPLQDLELAVARELAENPALLRREKSRPLRTCSLTDAVAQPATPADALVSDLVDRLDGDERAVAAFVLADLDGRGCLDRHPEDVARQLGVDVELVNRALSVLREGGPAGLAAPDVRGCLLAQLDAIDADGAQVALARQLLAYPEDLAGGRLSRLAELTGAPADAVASSLRLIRRSLRPYVSLPGGSPAPPPPPPDIALSFVADEPRARALGDPATSLGVDPLWRQVATSQRGRASERADARRWVSRAEGFLRQLERRRSALELVATAACTHQVAFLRDGPAHHRKLTRADVAAAVGVHESTVSRAVKNKVLRLPDRRTLPLADLFGASTSALEALRELLEGPGAGSSDRVLADELRRQGFPLARRTVTKYRAQLGKKRPSPPSR